MCITFSACRFAQVRARKLAEAVAAVNELLMQANSMVNTALAAPDVTAAQLTGLISQVRSRHLHTVKHVLLWQEALSANR